MSQKDDEISPPPKSRRAFLGPWDELSYLYDKLLYWFYGRQLRSRGVRFAERMLKILRELPDAYEVRQGNEYWALVSEVQGEWQSAAEFWQQEINLRFRIRELALEEEPSAREFLLEDNPLEEIADIYNLMAIDLRKSGRFEDALDAITQSEKICSEHGLEFDGAGVRADILDEMHGR